MNISLPRGFTVRAPTHDDAAAIVDLIIQNDILEFGQPAYTLGDLDAQWRRAGLDLARDAWLALAPDGMPAAYAACWDDGHLVYLANTSCVHPTYHDRGLEDWYLGMAEEWARSHVRDRPIILRHVVNANVAPRVARMERWGYVPVRQAWIMKIELDAPTELASDALEPSPLQQSVPAPEMPPGIEFRPFRPGRDERAAWACIQEAFRDMWDHPDSPFETWRAVTVEHASFSPELSRLAWDGGELAGAVLTMDYGNEAWLQQVGVRRPWRKRGVALALLRSVFTAARARNLPAAGLEVDGQSTTGALQLYERAGMHVAEHHTQFRKTLSVPEVTR